MQNTVAVGSAPSALRAEGTDLFLINMGRLPPTDDPSGRLIKLFLQSGEEKYRSFTTLLDSLQRPVSAVYADLNGDGRGDVVVAEFGFRTGRLAWHEWNGDGAPDIVYTAGDNADYQPVMKGYHGVRIFLNDGQNRFEEAYFYPLNGAYKAIARDYDQDGDEDLALGSFAALGMESAYIPARLRRQWLRSGPSLVILENKASGP